MDQNQQNKNNNNSNNIMIRFSSIYGSKHKSKETMQQKVLLAVWKENGNKRNYLNHWW